MTDTSDKLVLLMTFSTDYEARLVSGALEAEEGIATVIDNEIFASVLPIGFNSIGGVRLMVSRDDYPRALHWLEDHRDIE